MPATRTRSGEKYVALLRGINVGGNNRLPMPVLIEIFEQAGCTDVATYIQSGNVVFRAPAALRKKLIEVAMREIESRLGLKIPMVLRSASEMALVLQRHPFVGPGILDQLLHVCFLSKTPQLSDIARLDPDRSPGDMFRVIGSELYLYMPNGAADTKLTSAYIDSRLGCIGTARNWATVKKLQELTSA